MLGFAVAWAVFLGWSIATFTLLERAWGNGGRRPRGRRIAAAAGLLAVDALIARSIVWTADASAPILRVVLAWLVAELAIYWLHRAMHRVPLLWRFHRMHHDREPVAWTTAWYVHPIDAALFAGCALLGGVVAGVGAPGAVWFVVGRRAWTVLLHANIAWPASWLDRIVATPPFHHRHHDERHPATNFASTLPLLDRLFGTAG